MEILYNPSPLQKTYGEELIKKWLRKHKKTFDLAVIEQVLRLGKHNSSVNRLALLVGSIDAELGKQLKMLVKRFGHLLYEI